jgi:hypothetical protein
LAKWRSRVQLGVQSVLPIVIFWAGLALLVLLAWAFASFAQEKGYPVAPVLLLVLLTGPIGVVVVWLLPDRVGSPAFARRAVAMRNAVPRSRLYPRRAAVRRA